MGVNITSLWGRSMIGSMEQGRVLPLIIRNVVTLTHATRGVLLIADHDNLQVRAEASISTKLLHTPYSDYDSLPKDLIDHVRDSKEIITGNQAPSWLTTPYFLDQGIKDFICLPLFRMDRLAAIVYAEHDELFTIPKHDIETLRNLAQKTFLDIDAQNTVAAQAAVIEKLRQSQEELENVLHAMDDMVFLVNRDAKVLRVIESKPGLLFMPVEEIVGKYAHELVDPALVEPAKQFIDVILESGETLLQDYQIDIEGEPKWFEANISRYSEDTIIAIVRDITDRKQIEEDLRTSRTELEELFSAMDDLVFVFDAEGTYLRAIEARPGLLPIPADEIIGHNIREFFPPDIAQQALDRIQHCLEHGEADSFDYHFNTDAGRHWFEASFSRFSQKQQVVAIVRDITDRKKTEQELRTSQSELQGLFAAMQDLVVVTDIHGIQRKIVTADEGALVAPVDQLIGKSIQDLVPNETGTRITKTVQESITENKMLSLEYELEVLDGNRWFETNISPIGNQQAVQVIRDITDRKQIEEDLRKSRSELEALFASMQDLVIVVSKDGIQRKVVAADESALVMPADQIIGTSIMDIMAPDTAQYILGKIRQCIDEQTTTSLEYDLSLNGEMRWFEANFSPLDSDNVVQVVREITDRKHSEQALQQSQAELEALFNSMEDIVMVMGHDGSYRKIITTDDDLLYAPLEEMIGANITDILPEVASSRIQATIDLCLREKQTITVEYALTLHGNANWFEARVSPIDDEQVVWIARDISERKATEDALRNSQAELEALFAAMQDMVIVLDNEGVYQRIVSGLGDTQMLNDRMVGRSIEETLPPVSARGMRAAIEQCLTQQKTVQVDYQYNQDGQTKYFAAYVTPIDEKRIMWVTRDVSDIKQAEETLRTSQAEFEAVFAAMDELVFLFDQDGNYQKVMAYDPKILIRPPAEFIGSNITDTLPNGLAKKSLNIIHKTLETQAVQSFEYYLEVRGKQVWFEALISPVNENQVVWVSRDISERKLMEQTLRASSAELQALFASMQEVTFVVDANGTYQRYLVSDATAAKFDLPRIIGTSMYDYLPAKDANILRKAVRETLEKQESQRIVYEFPRITKDFPNEVITDWFEASLTPFGNNQIVLVARNINERMEYELQLEQAKRRCRCCQPCQKHLLGEYEPRTTNPAQRHFRICSNHAASTRNSA